MRKLLLPILLVALAWGLAQLFLLRFETGTVYPAYSTLRADPLGTRILYESLASLPGLAVSRNFQPLDKLRDSSGVTLFFLSANARMFHVIGQQLADDLETISLAGGRVIISLAPMASPPPKRFFPDLEKEKRKKEEKKKKDQKKKRFVADDEDHYTVQLGKRWNFDFAYDKRLREDDEVELTDAAGGAGLSKSVSWHSVVYFKNLGKSWRVICTRNKLPVMIERKLGRGTIVLSSDSYLLSNEAMRSERHPALLAWLAGENHRLVFDESHLGVMESEGIMTLARNYNLHGLFAGLLLLAGLFIWKNAASFIPSYENPRTAPAGQATGKDAASGLINLLRRTIPSRDLALVCFGEWKTSFAHRKDLAAKLERVEAVVSAEAALPARRRQPVETYRKISRTLTERK